MKGAHAGIGEGRGILRALNELLGKLKEPVILQLIASPEIPPNLIKAVNAICEGTSIVSYVGTIPCSLATEVSSAEEFAIRVMGSCGLHPLLGMAFDVFEIGDDSVSFQELTDDSFCFSCHSRLLVGGELFDDECSM